MMTVKSVRENGFVVQVHNALEIICHYLVILRHGSLWHYLTSYAYV
jgi:hypothetical protein